MGTGRCFDDISVMRVEYIWCEGVDNEVLGLAGDAIGVEVVFELRVEVCEGRVVLSLSKRRPAWVELQKNLPELLATIPGHKKNSRYSRMTR